MVDLLKTISATVAIILWLGIAVFATILVLAGIKWAWGLLL